MKKAAGSKAADRMRRFSTATGAKVEETADGGVKVSQRYGRQRPAPFRGSRSLPGGRAAANRLALLAPPDVRAVDVGGATGGGGAGRGRTDGFSAHRALCCRLRS